jgi:hypothetical protein
MAKTIYILKCDHEKYYVGSTNRLVNDRIIEHFNNNGSEWTKLHKPISIEKIIENIDNYDEDKYTKMYMNKYGIDNVRGGSYVTIKLSKHSVESIEKELLTSNNKCFNCGLPDHYAKNCEEKKYSCVRCLRDSHTIDTCYAQTDRYGNILDDYVIVEYSESESEEELEDESEDSFYCERCLRDGHTINTCYAKTNRHGNAI